MEETKNIKDTAIQFIVITAIDYVQKIKQLKDF